jgi:acetyl esterase/lipase
MSLQSTVINRWLRWVEKPAMARAKGPVQMRRRFEINARLMFHAPRGTTRKWHELGDVPTLQVTPPGVSGDNTIFYIHGGGFVFGSPGTHAAMLGQLASRAGTRAVLPRYRLAPEAVFPAATEDVRAAWDGLLATGVAANKVVVGGDSAGGALALGLLAQLCADKAELPAGVFCFSPLTDMTFSGESFRENVEAEVVLPADRADEMGQLYLAGFARDDPRASPLFADFAGAPSVWLTVGDTEILRDDSRRMAARLREFGVDVAFTERHDLPHVWPIMHNILPEGRETLDALAAWIRQRPGWQGES